MSPGNRPSHFGAKPLHITSPNSVVITPMITISFPSSRILQKVARIERRHKLESKCPYSFEIITRHSVLRKPPPPTRFAAAFGGFGGRAATAERGADVEADIMVTLEEALHGSTRTVSLRRAGSNKVENYQGKIPRGVHEGQRIRLRGQGEAGVRGGKSGDLFLRVRLARHPDFSVEGSDLIHEVKIEPWRAVLGSELVVPTLEGNVRLKIPPGTQGGQRFRLRERGLPGVSGKRGDLFVVVQINVPKKITEREKEIWRELAKLQGG